MTSNTSRLRISDAVFAALDAALTDPGAVVDPPPSVIGTGGRIIKPYWVVYPIEGWRVEPDLDDPHSMITFEYQVTSVGLTRAQAEWLADAVRSVMVGRDANGAFLYEITPVAGYVVDRSVSMFGGAVSDTPGAYTVAESYYLVVT